MKKESFEEKMKKKLTKIGKVAKIIKQKKFIEKRVNFL